MTEFPPISIKVADPTRVGSLQFESMASFNSPNDARIINALENENSNLDRENKVLRDQLQEQREKYQELLLKFSDIQNKTVSQNRLIRNLMREASETAHNKPEIKEMQALRKQNEELVAKVEELKNEKTRLNAWIARRKEKLDQTRVLKQQVADHKDTIEVLRGYNKKKEQKISNLQQVVDRYSKNVKELSERTNFSLDEMVQVLRVMIGEQPYETKKTPKEVETYYEGLNKMLKNMNNPESKGFDNLSLKELRQYLGFIEEEKKDPWKTFVNKGPIRFRVKTIPSED